MRNTGWGDSLESLDSLLQKRDSAQKKNQNPIIDHNRIWYLFCIQFSIRTSVSICVLFCSFGFFCCARALSDPHHARGGGGGGG